MATLRPILPLQDFQRISNAIAGIIVVERGELVGKCVLFGIMGASLLRHHYKMSDARPVIGAFSVCVAPSKVIAFVGHQGTSDNRQNFHCWVEAAGWVFDFSSIIYPRLARDFLGVSCEPLMFQKQAALVSQSTDILQKPGTFYFREDNSLREQTIVPTLGVPAMQDILQILEEWYQPPPKKMHVIGIEDGKGNSKHVAIHNSVLVGAW
jgi:Protein of unknown function (DUF2026)